jgi:hypothetical protein
MRSQVVFVLAVLFLIAPHSSKADSADDNSSTSEAGSVAVVQEPSAAVSDPRLPPILPGAEVQPSEHGPRMRVWSTTGGVSVNQAPTAPVAPSNGESAQLPAGTTVIVDGRQERQRIDRPIERR